MNSVGLKKSVECAYSYYLNLFPETREKELHEWISVNEKRFEMFDYIMLASCISCYVNILGLKSKKVPITIKIQ